MKDRDISVSRKELAALLWDGEDSSAGSFTNGDDSEIHDDVKGNSAAEKPFCTHRHVY